MKVLAVAGDPGGAQAVAEVVRELRMQNAQVITAAYGAAVTLLAPIDYELKTATTVAEAENLLRKLGAEVLLCGTSLNGRDDEKRFIIAARQLGIPSLAVLDFWSNYLSRLSTAPPNGPLDAIPDCLAVMDEAAVEDLCQLGVTTEAIRVTGQPAFDRLHAKVPHTSNVAALRQAIGCPLDRHLLVFASQPLSELASQPGFTPMPYDEREVLSVFCEELRIHPAAGRLFLWIRPHPRESPGKFATHAGSSIFVGLVGDSATSQHAAEGVIGLCSVFLLEAALIGKPVLSLQPGATGPSPVPLDRLKIGLVVKNHNIRPAVKAWLDQWNGESQVEVVPAKNTMRSPHASRRVVAEMQALTRQKAPASLKT